MDQVTTAIDISRTRAGFLTIGEAIALSNSGVVVLDPFSTLISAGVDLSPGVTLWPNVIIQTAVGGRIAVGAGAQLYPGTRIVAAAGRISIGKRSEIGEEGGFTIKADEPGCVIDIGADSRLMGGGSLTLNNSIGDGAQVLGPIRVQDCVLAAGGSYREADPDKRGAVLKGSGVARQIQVPTGMVIQAFGLFSEASLRQQSDFHPPRKR